MISKNQLRYYSSLLSKKIRKTENKFLVEGEKSVLEGLRSKFSCEVIFITNQFAEEGKNIADKISSAQKKILTLSQKEFEKISDTETPQGIAAVFLKPNQDINQLKLIKDKLLVMLDNISDPGNLGTIFRNCDWFGIQNVLLSENIVDYTNPKVIRASMGSIFHVNIFENISDKNLKDLKLIGYEILCADIEGENIFSYKSEMKKVVIFSSESHGPSDEIEKVSDRKICIPKIGNAESLNVASASAVLLAVLTK